MYPVHYLHNSENKYILAVAFRCGSINENPKHSGISHLLEHMMFKAKTNKQSIDRLDALFAAGVDWNAYTSKDMTIYYVSTDVVNYKNIFNVLMHILKKMDVSKGEFEKEKAVVKEELALSSRLFPEMLFNMAHANTPYKQSVIGTTKTLSCISWQDTLDYHANFYKDPIVIVNCPEAHKGRVARLLKPHLGEGRSVQQPLLLDLNAERYVHEVVNLKKDHEGMEKCVVGYLGFPHSSYKTATCRLMAYILTLRLFRELREKRGMVYGVKVTYITYMCTGYMTVVCRSNNAKCDKILEIVTKEISRLSNLTKEEYAQYNLSLETKRINKYTQVDLTMNAACDKLYGVQHRSKQAGYESFKSIHASLFKKSRMMAIAKTACGRNAILKSLDL
jgi:predicted Zn-dependent peptidase